MLNRPLKVFGAALGLRLLFILLYAWAIPVQWGGRELAGWEMGSIAINLAHGRGFSSPFFLGDQPTAWLCPLVPILWAGIIKLAGEATGRTEAIIVVLQAVASSISAALYVSIFRRVAPRAPALVARLFLVAVLFWPETHLRMVHIWYHQWQELSIAALVWFGIRWFEERTTASAVVLGAVGGVAALINVLPVSLFALVLALPVFSFRGRRVVVCACAGGLVALLIVSPWLARNYVVFGRFVPLRANSGLELLQGNNPNGSVKQRENSLHPYNVPAELERYRAMGELEYNRDALSRATAWMRENPGAAVIKVVQRIYVTWLTDVTDAWSWDGTKWWSRRYTLVLQSITTFGALATIALAIAGLRRTAWRAIPYRWLLVGPFLVTVPHYFTQVEDEYVAFVRFWLLLLAAVCFCVERRPELEYATVADVDLELKEPRLEPAVVSGVMAAAAGESSAGTVSHAGIGAELTIVIPAYRCAPFLPAAVESALHSPASTILIAHDAGCSDTLRVAQRYEQQHPGRVRVLPSRTRRGAANNVNEAVGHVKTPYFVKLDGDDVLIPGHLEAVFPILASRPDVAVVAGHELRITRDEAMQFRPDALPHSPGDPRPRFMSGAEAFRFILTWSPNPCSSGAVYRTALFRRVGGFDPRIGWGEDWEIWLRLAQHWEVAYCDVPSALYRIHPDSTTARERDQNRLCMGYEAVYRKAAEICSYPEAGPLLRRAFLRVARLYAAAASREAWGGRNQWLFYGRHAVRALITAVTVAQDL